MYEDYRPKGRKFLLITLSFFIIAVAILLLNQRNLVLVPPPACNEPIAYTVGSFDRRFGISHEEFLQALDLAEEVWEEPSGRDLFVYSPENATLPVNLVYDYRQETTSTLSGLGEALEQNEESYNALKADYLNIKATYDRARVVYEARVNSFNAANDAFAERVEAWNDGPRTSKNEFENLGKARNALEKEATELKRLENELNMVVVEVNSLVEKLNSTAEHLNLDVDRYNTIGSSRGETFTGGIYYENNSEQGIDIFEFSSQDKLVRILAHEFGHALGLEHNNDPGGIMYYLNQGESIALSPTDLNSLEILCGAE